MQLTLKGHTKPHGLTFFWENLAHNFYSVEPNGVFKMPNQAYLDIYTSIEQNQSKSKGEAYLKWSLKDILGVGIKKTMSFNPKGQSTYP